MDAMDDDPFDAVLALEERFHERGLAEGRREGVRRGREQGRALGERLGAKAAAELGFLRGVAATLTALAARFPDAIPPRALKSLASISAIVDALRLEDPHEEGTAQRLQLARAKFMVVLSTLGMQHLVRRRDKPTLLSF